MRIAMFVAVMLVSRLVAGAQQEIEGVKLAATGTQPEVLLTLQWEESQRAFVFFMMVTSKGCRYEGVVTGEFLANGVHHTPVRFLRSSQEKEGESCVEGLITLAAGRMLGEVGSADRVAIVLPTGPIELSKPALNLIRAKVTARAMAVPVPTGFPSDQGVAIDAYLRLVQAQRYAEALGVAEHRVSTAQSLPDRVTARLHLAAAKRALGDVEGAVSAYEEGIALARPAADGDEDVRLSLAVLSDNLALLRGVQGRYAEAMAASATALEMFERSLGPRNLQYAQALNTRSVLLFEAGKRDEAIAASNRALALVREIFKNDPARLAPFITDNQIITGGPAR